MKKITLLMLFFSAFLGHSQVKNYTFGQSNGTYTELTGTTTSLGDITTNDQFFVNPSIALGGSTNSGSGFDIGFDFIYNGVTYNRFGVHANGWIALGSSAYTPSVNMVGGGGSSYAQPLMSLSVITPTALSARIAPLATDLKAQANASIQFQLSGTTPNRVMVIQWKNYKRGLSGTGDSLNFQVVLHENNTIDFVYGSFGTGASTSPEVGMTADPITTSAYPTNFVCRTGSWGATTAAATVTTTMALQTGSVPTSGLTFTWTPACSEPKDLVASALTTTSATLTWSSFLPSPTAYQYFYSTSATLPTGTGTDVSSATFTATDLSPNTNYYVFVRSACGAQSSKWINIGSFRTKCLDITASYTENFDSYTAGASSMPYCWSTAGNDVCYIEAGGSASAPNRLYMSSNGASVNPTVSYAILPAVTNLKLGTYRLKFKAFAGTADRRLDVGYFTDINNPTTFTALMQDIILPSPAAANAQEYRVVPPTSIPDGVKNLVFRNAGMGSATAGQAKIYIDDVIWELNPACSDVNNVAVKLPTTNSVNLSWNVTGTETAWQYIAAPSTVTDPDTLPTTSIVNVDVSSVTTNGTSRALTVNGLTLNTSYKIWIRSKCSDTAFGLWSATQVFMTPCPTVASIVEDFDSSTTVPACWNKLGDGTVSIVPSMGTGSSNALKLAPKAQNSVLWLELPPLSTTASGYRLRFKYRTDANFATFQIVNLQDPANIIEGSSSNYTVLATPAIAKDVQYTFNSTLTGSSPYLAFRVSYTSVVATSVYIDDLVWEPVPTCQDVSAVIINGITDESVNLGWTKGSAEDKWQYALGTSATTNPSGLAAVDFSLTYPSSTGITSSIANLIPSTSYKLWIRSKCSATSLGAWIGPIYFKTNCSAVETFIQNFDSSTDFPSCWSKAGTINAVVATQAGTSSPNILKIDGNTNTGQQGIVAMQPVSNAGDGTNVLRFRLSGSVVGAKVEVGYTTNASDPLKFVSLNKVFTVGSTTAFSNESIELGFEPGSQVLAFRNPGKDTNTSTVYIDDVVWEALPPCPNISNVAFTGITSSSVGLSWAKGGTEASWQYAITNTAQSDPTKLTAANFTNPVVTDSNVASTISGLTPSTTYKVWVRSKCSGSMQGSWIGSFTFTTTCAPTSAKFSEQFDLNTNLPACWAKVGTTGTVSVTPTSGGSAPNALTLVSNATDKAVVALPPVANAAAGTYRLRFKFKSSVANSNIQIGYVTNVTDSNSFVLVQAFSAAASDVFYGKTVDFGTNPTSELLAFKNLNASTIMIDDVFWEPVPTCSDVSEAVASKITSSSIELGWKLGGSETAWQYALGASTDINPDLLSAVDFVNPIVSTPDIAGKINNLTPSTSYKVWIRSKCSGSEGVWIGPYSFSTTCAPTIGIAEKFDANTSLPACWTKIGTAGTVAVVVPDPFTSGATAPNALSLVSSATAKAIVALPPVTNAGAGTYVLRFKFRSSVANGNIQIGYLTNITDPASFTSIQSFTAAAKDAYYVRAVFPGTVPTSELLAFKNPDASTVYIDDVSWEPIPSCPDLSSLVSPVKSSSTTVDLTWKAGGTETAWQYVMSTSTDENPSLLATNAVNFVGPVVNGSDVIGKINGLTPSTSYRIWVRAKCSDTSFGPWSDKVSFATNCPPVATFVQNFDTTDMPACWSNKGGSNASASINALSMNYTPASTQPVVAMQPVSNAAAGTHRLRFQFKVGIANGVVEVGYLKVLSDPNSFVPLKSYTKVQTGVYEPVVAQWNDDQVSEVLAFRTASPSIIIDEVNWEPIPGCADIKALAAKTVTGTTAAFTWTAGGAETKWQYVKGGATDTDPASLNAVDLSGSASVTLSNLTPLTTYKIWVRSKCDDGSVGVWGQPVVFTTPCAFVPDFTENFETINNGSLPSCWKKVGNGSAAVASPPNNIAGSTSYLSTFNYDDSSTATVAMPPVSNILDGTLYLNFKLAAEIAVGALDVGYIKDVADPTSFVKIVTVKTTAANKFQPQSVKIPVLPAEAKLLAFRNTTISTFVYVDDVFVNTTNTAVLGIDSFDDINFSYYPNPVRDVLNLTLNQEITNVAVFNLLGQQLINQSANGEQARLDMSGLSKGAYLIKVIAGNQSKTIKVIKE